MKILITILLGLLFSIVSYSQTIDQLTKRVEALEAKQMVDDATGTLVKTKYFIIIKRPGGVDTMDLNTAAVLQFILANIPGQQQIDIKPLQTKLDSFIQVTDNVTKTLFANDNTINQKIADSGRSINGRLYKTDSIASVTRTAMISYYALGKSYSDAALIPIKTDIGNMQIAQGLSSDQVTALAAKLELVKGTIPKGLLLNGTFTY